MTKSMFASHGVLLLAALSLGACARKSSSGVDASTAAATAAAPDGIWRMVPADGIENFIPPGNSSDLPGWGAALEGIWYCHANDTSLGLFDGAVLLTLHGSAVSADQKSFHFGTYAPQHYGFNPKAFPYTTLSDKQPLKAAVYLSYDVAFTSATEAHLIIYTSKTLNGPTTIHTRGYSFTASLDPSDSDHFIRKSSILIFGAPNYDLYRIVDGSGKHTAHYDDIYRADIAGSGDSTLAITVPPGSPLATQDIAAPGATPGTGADDLSAAKVPGSNSPMPAPDPSAAD